MQEARQRCPVRTLFYLSERQLERIKPFFPRSHGAPRVDDRSVVSGIIYVIKHGFSGRMHLMRTARTKRCTIRFIRWSRLGIFNKIFTELANKTPFDGSLMITPPISRLTVRRQACSKRGFSTSYRTNKRWPEFQTPYRL